MAEFVLIIGMFALILLICGVTMVLFTRQYKKEMREKAARLAAKKQAGQAAKE